MTYESTKIKKAANTLKSKKSLHEENFPEGIQIYNDDLGRPELVNSKLSKYCVPMYVEKFKYHACKLHNDKKKESIAMYPVLLKSHIAFSDIPYTDYRYTNGGDVFRKAVFYAKEIEEELRTK